MSEFLAINKALQNIHGELLNNTFKLTEIDKRVERDTKKLEEVENDPTYTNEQRQSYRDNYTISQNRKDLQTHVVRIKQTIEKVLDKDASLAERIRTLFK